MENKTLVQQLGDNVRRLRKDRGLSLAEVSARMAESGVPLSLNSISKVELGNRGLDLHELMALAKALEVPPLLVIFPIGSEPTVELLPGRHAPTWPTARWFTGEDGFPTPGTDGGWDVVGDDRYSWVNAVTNDFRGQEVAIDRWRRARISGDSDQEEAWERSLRLIRDRIRSRGLDPGELPADVAHLEDNGAGDGQR